MRDVLADERLGEGPQPGGVLPVQGVRRYAGADIGIKLSDRVNVTLGPALERSNTVAQYVTSVTDPTATSTYGSRYVFGALNQTRLIARLAR